MFWIFLIIAFLLLIVGGIEYFWDYIVDESNEDGMGAKKKKGPPPFPSPGVSSSPGVKRGKDEIYKRIRDKVQPNKPKSKTGDYTYIDPSGEKWESYEEYVKTRTQGRSKDKGKSDKDDSD